MSIFKSIIKYIHESISGLKLYLSHAGLKGMHWNTKESENDIYE